MTCNENLTLQIGKIGIHQYLRFQPNLWLEVGSIEIPELRLNGKLDCHTSSLTYLDEQINFLRLHDQRSERLHFLYNIKSHSTNFKRTTLSNVSNNFTLVSCACLGGSPGYFSLVSGDQFFNRLFLLTEQSTFGSSLFRPDCHVLYSHSIFQHRYDWPKYSAIRQPNVSAFEDEGIFYPFDFCSQSKVAEPQPSNETTSDNTIPILRTHSARLTQQSGTAAKVSHHRSASSIPLSTYPIYEEVSLKSVSTLASAAYGTPAERLSTDSLASRASSAMSLNTLQRQISTNPTENLSIKTSSSDDSLAPFEKILEQENPRNSFLSSPTKVIRSRYEL